MNDSGRRDFRVLLLGQALSLLGTGMTKFALLIWAYEQAGTATALALLGFSVTIAYVVASPLAGVLVDRWDRRRVMFLADLGAGLTTAAMLGLHLTGRLEVWHLYLSQGIAGVLGAFQEPAFSAATTLLLPKDDYTRSNALFGLGRSAAHILAPAFAGLLMQFGGLTTVMVADLGTLGLALLGLAFVRIPAPPPSSEGQHANATGFREQLLFGTRYIWGHRGLRGLIFTFFLVNLFGTVAYFAVLSPMILARTGGDEVALGIVRTVMGVGGIVGGIVISVWGGPRRKVRTYLISVLFSFLVCDFLAAVSQGVTGWSIAGFLAEFSIPFIISPYFALWQERVPADVQGRVFATREMVQVLSQPAGYLAGGLLADRLFEPLMAGGSPLADFLSGIVGTGPGSGMAVIFLGTSLLGALVGVAGLLSPRIRALDDAAEPAGGAQPVTAEAG